MWIHANEVLNNAVVRIVNAAANFLPGLLALLIIMFFTFLVAFVVRAILRRSLEGMRFDARLSEWGLQALADWEPARKPSALIAQLVTEDDLTLLDHALAPSDDAIEELPF